ncbi:MAG: hypothetical protein HHJ18_16420 [Polaromonas sp.]|nr:hypothetical protein [Polaromonas sp.]
MLAGVMALSACSLMPTESQGEADRRPQISFKATTERVLNSKIILDGIDMGQVGSYLEGDTSLRIDTGSHTLIVASNNRLIYQQSFHAGSGYSRTFTVY